MGREAIRGWYLVHKWTSLICTLVLLMLCVTGLPLIFHEELDSLLGDTPALRPLTAADHAPSLDQIAAKVLASRPGEVVQFMGFDADRPVVTVGVAATPATPFPQSHSQAVDLRTGEFLRSPPQDHGFMWFLKQAHTELFAGLKGTLFIGAMGLLFIVATVSGVVVYAQFMRKLEFGTVRMNRSARLRWLDLHNLFGIAIAAWLLAVGVTGVFNTLDQPLAAQWKSTQLADMTAPYRHAPPLAHLGSVDVAVAAAERASPGMEPASISWPGTFFSTPHHYNVFLRGAQPVSKRLIKPSLVDAATGRLTDTRDMPLHIRALFLSRPLHFGDYGGLLLKTVWAGLDLAAIAVLVSGLYLWLGRRRAPLERRLDELETGGVRDRGAA